MAAYLIGALLSRYYLVCVGCDKSSTRLLSILVYVALAHVNSLFYGHSKLLSMLLWIIGTPFFNGHFLEVPPFELGWLAWREVLCYSLVASC